MTPLIGTARVRRRRLPRPVASINVPRVTKPTVPVVPGTTTPAAPPAPSAPPAAPVSPSGDAEYFAVAARRAFDREQKLGDLTAQSGYDKTDFQEALRRMGEQRGQVEQGTREGANREGLFYSGQLGKRLGDVATDYTRRQADQQQAFDRREAAREAARRAIEAGAPLEDAVALAQSADRQLARDQEAAAAGALAGPAATPAAAPSNPAQQAFGASQARQQALSAQQADLTRARRRRRRPR